MMEVSDTSRQCHHCALIPIISSGLLSAASSGQHNGTMTALNPVASTVQIALCLKGNRSMTSSATMMFLPTVARVGCMWVSRCWTTSCSSKGPRLSWFRSTGGFRQRANFSLAPERFPAMRDAIPHACHTPLGSRPLLVDTLHSRQTTSGN